MPVVRRFEAALARPEERADVVQSLQARIRSMQATGLGSRELPTAPALAPLLPGGALRAGAAYATRSPALALLLAAGPAAAGAWTAVVGVPDLGIEAAAAVGVDLARLVLVPEPGEHWLAVAAQLADVLPVVVLQPPAIPSAGDIARLASRLRQRGAVLVVLGAWPQAEAVLEVTASTWTGLGTGHGHLTGRVATVAVTGRDGVRRHELELPAEHVPPLVPPRPLRARGASDEQGPSRTSSRQQDRSGAHVLPSVPGPAAALKGTG